MSLMCCAKYLLIVFSCSYWVFGALTVAGCVWILNDPMFSLIITQPVELFKYAIYVVLFSGCLTLLSACFGCYGVLKQSTFYIGAFIFFLLFVVGFKIAVCTWISCNEEKISDLLMASFKYLVQEEYGQISTSTVAFDVIQKNLICCGADGPSDWMASQYNNAGGEVLTNIAFSSLNVFYSIPESCCNIEISDASCEIARMRKLDAKMHLGINKEGCVQKLAMIVSKNSGLVFITFICAISFEIIVIGLSLLLCFDTFKNPNKKNIS